MEEKPILNRDEVNEAIRRFQMVWYFMLSLPIVYLLVCIGIREVFFEDGQRGFLAPTPRTERVLLTSFIVLTCCAQVALVFLKQFFNRRIGDNWSNYGHVVLLLWKRLFYTGMICDTVSFLGLLYYILLGDLRVMFVFGIVSYLLYGQIMPRDRLMRKLLQ